MPNKELPRVVIDTNIYISAIFWGGLPRKVVDMGVDDPVQLRLRSYQIFTSFEIIEEIQSTLNKKFRLSKEHSENIVRDILTFSEIVSPPPHIAFIPKDPDDEKFINCEIACRAHFLVSGDMHLRRLRSSGDIRIIGPREFLEAIEKKSLLL